MAVQYSFNNNKEMQFSMYRRKFHELSHRIHVIHDIILLVHIMLPQHRDQSAALTSKGRPPGTAGVVEARQCVTPSSLFLHGKLCGWCGSGCSSDTTTHHSKTDYKLNLIDINLIGFNLLEH